MDLGETVALGEQIQNATRVGHEVSPAERPCIGGHRMLVSENQHRQALVVLVERSDDRLASAPRFDSEELTRQRLPRV